MLRGKQKKMTMKGMEIRAGKYTDEFNVTLALLLTQKKTLSCLYNKHETYSGCRLASLDKKDWKEGKKGHKVH